MVLPAQIKCGPSAGIVKSLQSNLALHKFNQPKFIMWSINKLIPIYECTHVYKNYTATVFIYGHSIDIVGVGCMHLNVMYHNVHKAKSIFTVCSRVHKISILIVWLTHVNN